MGHDSMTIVTVSQQFHSLRAPSSVNRYRFTVVPLITGTIHRQSLPFHRRSTHYGHDPSSIVTVSQEISTLRARFNVNRYHFTVVPLIAGTIHRQSLPFHSRSVHYGHDSSSIVPVSQ
ncbi:hypothetical protein [Bacillus niameyensis]|uniref:hypothetical protein n=1 Tax=Bacillus niameyensis TaxID=1522308 RepID=UPI001E2BEFBB|nr:hypothetical protein [Bacillus niameyensis]